jgi:hypothetical protein
MPAAPNGAMAVTAIATTASNTCPNTPHLFQLTSGEADSARATWAPLKQILRPAHYLSEFVTGLEALIGDRFTECIDALHRGIAANSENAPLNRDMELIVEKCAELLAQSPQPAPPEDVDEVSVTSFLLGARRH